MADKVTYWKSVDDSLHPTEKEAVANDLLIIGEDKFYEQTVKRINNAYGESQTFSYYEIPDKILYKLIDNGFTSVLWSLESNADLPEQFNIVVYKRGIEPKHRLKFIIRPKKN